MEISKADWKLFREKVPEWQEHYMEQLVKGYKSIKFVGECVRSFLGAGEENKAG